jgi:hypothetical protein
VEKVTTALLPGSFFRGKQTGGSTRTCARGVDSIPAKAYCENVLRRNKGKAASRGHGQGRDVADALFQAVQDLPLASTSTSGGKREEHAEPPEDRQSFGGVPHGMRLRAGRLRGDSRIRIRHRAANGRQVGRQVDFEVWHWCFFRSASS